MATESYLENEIAKVRNDLQNKYQEYMGTTTPLAVNGKTVILVDDSVEDDQNIIAIVELLKKIIPVKLFWLYL